MFENKKPEEDEEAGDKVPGLSVELDERVCHDCGKQAPAWVQTCPSCGGELVERDELEPARDALLERLLAEDEAEDQADGI